MMKHLVRWIKVQFLIKKGIKKILKKTPNIYTKRI